MTENAGRVHARRRHRSILGATVATLSIASGCSSDAGSDAGAADAATSEGRAPVIIEASERYLSHTFEDWLRQADAVVLAEVVSERRREPVADATSPKRYPVGRTIAVEVVEVYWQREGHATPDQFEMNAWGWMALETGEERPSVGERSARLEVGHRYLIALDDAGAGAKEALWTILGSGAGLPADSVIGVGEHEAQIIREPGPRNTDSDQVADAVARLDADAAGALIAQRLNALSQATQGRD